jgi:uncharacterized protein involved in tolerance to divalent cations
MLGGIKYTLLSCLNLIPVFVSFRWLLEISKDKNNNLSVDVKKKIQTGAMTINSAIQLSN